MKCRSRIARKEKYQVILLVYSIVWLFPTKTISSFANYIVVPLFDTHKNLLLLSVHKIMKWKILIYQSINITKVSLRSIIIKEIFLSWDILSWSFSWGCPTPRLGPFNVGRPLYFSPLRCVLILHAHSMVQWFHLIFVLLLVTKNRNNEWIWVFIIFRFIYD